jgi:hypothetical protein
MNNKLGGGQVDNGPAGGAAAENPQGRGQAQLAADSDRGAVANSNNNIADNHPPNDPNINVAGSSVANQSL